MASLTTGIEELDLVLGGGLEPGSLVAFGGPPGTGKTILAQQVCFASAVSGRNAIYYTTLSEPHSKLVRHLEPFSFFDPDALERNVDLIHLGDLLRKEDTGGALGTVVSEVVDKCFTTDPAVVVIDSAKALRDFVDDRSLRTAFYELASRVAHTEAVLIFVGEYTPEEFAGTAEFSLADAIIQLAYEPHEPVDRRWLRVLKMRGANHLPGKHSFRITPEGCQVFPRLETVVPEIGARDLVGRASSGVPELDELAGGGIPQADATAILGPSGCGKTVLGLRFISQGLADGERCVYVSFQENADQLATKAAAFGWDFEGALESGQLAIHHVPPGELDLDIVGGVVRRALGGGAVRRVVLDSLAELVVAARETERFSAYARSLVGLIRGSGASVLVTSETSTLGPEAEPVSGLSFLFHNVILLRYVEMESEIRRAVSILKMRDSAHAKGVYQFEIDAHGFQIMDKLEAVTGLLGWSALRTRPGNDLNG